jgi:hypothetical protein
VVDLPEARPLSELTSVDPGLLTVFVVGPGQGEAVAAALPGNEWVFVDGCRSAARTMHRTNPVLGALQTIERLDAEPGRVLPLSDTANIPTSGLALLRVVSPARDALQAAWAAMPDTLRPNPLSVVLTITFGDTMAILGADLPVSEHGAPVATGWPTVTEAHPELVHHSALKLPHHGSVDAIDDRVMGGPPAHRAWVSTPFNTHDLPRQEAVDLLLQRQGRLHLTAPAVSREYQSAVDQGRVARVSAEGLSRVASRLAPGVLFTEADHAFSAGFGGGPFDHVWAVALDDRQRVVGRWAGPGALEIRRD